MVGCAWKEHGDPVGWGSKSIFWSHPVHRNALKAMNNESLWEKCHKTSTFCKQSHQVCSSSYLHHDPVVIIHISAVSLWCLRFIRFLHAASNNVTIKHQCASGLVILWELTNLTSFPKTSHPNYITISPLAYSTELAAPVAVSFTSWDHHFHEQISFAWVAIQTQTHNSSTVQVKESRHHHCHQKG